MASETEAYQQQKQKRRNRKRNFGNPSGVCFSTALMEHRSGLTYLRDPKLVVKNLLRYGPKGSAEKMKSRRPKQRPLVRQLYQQQPQLANVLEDVGAVAMPKVWNMLATLRRSHLRIQRQMTRRGLPTVLGN